MKLEEIDYQYPPNNETASHVAPRKKHKEIIEILLRHGAQPSLSNREGQQADETEEIKGLFKRPQSSCFAFLHSSCDITIVSQPKLSCKSCLLVNNNSMYEWELVDRNASEKALQFRREFRAHPSIDVKVWKTKLHSLKKGYLIARSQDLSTVNGAMIHDCFERALHCSN